MRDASMRVVEHAAVAAGFIFEIVEGTVVLSVPPPFLDVTAQIACNSSYFTQCIGRAKKRFFIIGRENVPPLRGLRKLPELPKRLDVLRTSRTAIGHSVDELRWLIRSVPERGLGVNNDMYLFDQSGHWLLYLSHHEEVSLKVPLRPAVGAVGGNSWRSTRRTSNSAGGRAVSCAPKLTPP